MAKVLILAPSGFGKTSSIGRTEELGINGLDPETTFVISVTSKPLSFPNSNVIYPITTLANIKTGRRVITNNATEVVQILGIIGNEKSPYTNIIIDDFNYIAQDYYMDNALKTGWDTAKKIGFDMNSIFKAMEKIHYSKNVYVLAHGEKVPSSDGRDYIKLKTT